MNKYDIDTDYLVNRIIEGYSIRDLAKECNCSPACVYKRIKYNYNGALKEGLDEALRNNYKNSNVKRWKK